MKIVLSGGTGFLGARLVEHLAEGGHEVVLLSRTLRQERRPGVRSVLWDGVRSGAWVREIDAADAVINLAGEPIAAKRWSAAQKEKILRSRVDATRAVVEAIRGAATRDRVLINASAAGYYGDVRDGEVTEERMPGRGFLAETCLRWEEEAVKAEDLGVRVVLMRTGIVLGEGGGALAKMLVPFRLFVGGPLGSGAQWFPWIHRDDVVGALVHVLQTPGMEGPVNTSAPEPVTMGQFCLALGNVLHRPSWIPVPAFFLRLVMGEMAVMVLSGQKMVPRKLLASGYKFRYHNVLQALEALFV